MSACSSHPPELICPPLLLIKLWTAFLLNFSAFLAVLFSTLSLLEYSCNSAILCHSRWSLSLTVLYQAPLDTLCTQCATKIKSGCCEALWFWGLLLSKTTENSLCYKGKWLKTPLYCLLAVQWPLFRICTAVNERSLLQSCREAPFFRPPLWTHLIT